ncbi:MAG: hypothetical protein JSW01_01490 [Candidatus Bathyarchaeota archaeon]|nr:MAG: hypothetical protein JSW01_01490 [Candidatus Bathyarchaeota archaeon]
MVKVQTCVYFGRDHHAQDVASSEMFRHVKRLNKFKMVWNEKIGGYCVEGEASKREFRRLADTAITLGCKVTQRSIRKGGISVKGVYKGSVSQQILGSD